VTATRKHVGRVLVAALVLIPSLAAAQITDRRACDLDGDGRDDLVMTSVGGSTVRVQTNVLDPGSQIGFVGALGWELAGCGDLDGDGRDDLVYDGPTAIRIDLMNGATVTSRGWIGNGGGAFRVAAIVDTGADGRDDLLLSGDAAIRIDVMNGTAVVDRSWLPNTDSPYRFRFAAAAVRADGGGVNVVRDRPTSFFRFGEHWRVLGAQWEFWSSIQNGDGAYPLVAIAQVAPGGSRAFVGDGASFTRIGFRYLPAGDGAWRYRFLADLDGDAIDDLVSAGDVEPDFVRVALLAETIGTTTGPMTKAIGWVDTGGGAYTLRQSGDFDGDGKSDLAFASPTGVRIDLMDGVVSTERRYVTVFDYVLPELR
jgi:hypothetical protein